MATQPFVLRFLVPEDYINIPIATDVAKALHLMFPSLFPPSTLKIFLEMFIAFFVIALISLAVHSALGYYYGDYGMYFAKKYPHLV